MRRNQQGERFVKRCGQRRRVSTATKELYSYRPPDRVVLDEQNCNGAFYHFAPMHIPSPALS